METIFFCHSEALAEESQNRLSDFAQDDKNNLTVKSYSPNTLLPYYLKKKIAFTLAEVLITLGVIGVVAALVMPGVINGFKTKELKTRFNKTNAVVLNGLRAATTEYGIDNWALLRMSDFNEMKERGEEINKIFQNQFPGAKPLSIGCHNREIAKCHNFYGERAIYCERTYGQNSIGILLPDGSFISNISTAPHRLFGIMFDTNGPYKGPNAYGHDVWRFELINPPDETSYYDCPASSAGTCYRYAQIDQNPYDNSMGYFESLYHSRDWWTNLKNKNNK